MSPSFATGVARVSSLSLAKIVSIVEVIHGLFEVIGHDVA